jgi:electron transport complex protein RnfD
VNVAATPSFDIARTLHTVLLALVPGIVVATWFLGLGALINIALAALFAAMAETLALHLKREPIMPQLRDGSALITALLIALALPPFAPWWIVLVACATAILLGKHCYGGLGQNIFNPAMTGYALVLLTFPAQLAHWPALAPQLDGYTSATVLDTFKQNHALTVADWWRRHAQFGEWGGYGWEWINLAFLGGGLFLLWQKIFSWHIPVAMLATLGLCAAAFYDNGSSASAGSPLFHWLSGATMLGAFFVATDPATAASKPLGRILYGALIGALVFAIRHAGHYADGVAFAVLGANAAALLLDKIDAQALRNLMKPAGGPTDER